MGAVFFPLPFRTQCPRYKRLRFLPAKTKWPCSRLARLLFTESRLLSEPEQVFRPKIKRDQLAFYLFATNRQLVVDVTGIEPATPCLQNRAGKTLTALSGVAYAEISEISALLVVPKLSRTRQLQAHLVSSIGREPSSFRRSPEAVLVDFQRPDL